MKKSNLKEIYTYINQTTEKEVDFESVDLPNNKIKHIIIGNKKVNQPKKQSSMTTKQFQEFVIEFIQEQKLVNQRQEETNKVVMQRLDKQEEFNQMILEKVDNIEKRLTNVENDVKEIKIEIKKIKVRLDKIESCPTIKKELKFS